MSLLQSIIMGIIQGLTEFLPVSSSGHLVLFGNILGVETNTGVLFEIMLHIGTIISIVVVFYRDVLGMITGFFGMVADTAKGRGLGLEKSPHRWITLMVIAASVPTAIMGLLFDDYIEKAFASVRIVSIMLIVTGIFLYIANNIKSGPKGQRDMKISDALVVGIFQGFAITPGISRSGSTIFAGLNRGFSRELATRFSFIMSIPAIVGAAVLEFWKYYGETALNENMAVVFAGMATAAIAGTIAIKFLVELIKKRKLSYFAYYCWLVGGVSLIVSFL